MARSCACEEVQQSALSPGVVEDDELIYFAIVRPDMWDEGRGKLSNNAFGRSKLWDQEPKKRPSVARATHTSRQILLDRVIEPQRLRNPNRSCGKVGVALTRDIREIAHGDANDPCFCLIDDGNEGFVGHGLISPADKFIAAVPEKNIQSQMRQKLTKLFEGKVVDLDSIP